MDPTPTAPDHRQVYIECPPEWGPGQALITRLERLGYDVEDHRALGRGERWLTLR
ncbi:hypothetical protein [Actinomadura sp. K4S16]|uniref:hypothetical protein n=1 Tax=Actinomadura sp. K4S16 TaxID=1316147 RepID=UPI00135949E6|nr:hypothetical protein [Actinomadura sp. K4S16]